MEIKKTLWLLEYGDEHVGRLVPLYAADESGAWLEAAAWAIRNRVVLPETATLIHFPHGFTIHRCTLPGEIIENGEEKSEQGDQVVDQEEAHSEAGGGGSTSER